MSKTANVFTTTLATTDQRVVATAESFAAMGFEVNVQQLPACTKHKIVIEAASDGSWSGFVRDMDGVAVVGYNTPNEAWLALEEGIRIHTSDVL